MRTDKQYLQAWQEFRDNINRATPIDLTETPIEKRKRIERLEKDDEAWFAYYFPNFYTAEPADFQRRSTRLVMSNDELYLVRSWARELAKSAKTMMETMKRMLTGRNQNLLLVSDSLQNAMRLLLPYKVNLESNNRIIHDYGPQQSLGNWEAHEFKTKSGKSFRALGAGQSPRGTRNDAARPDIILIDDIDTDQDVRNPDIIKERVRWIESALIPTRSISKPLLLIACGNIIADYCCITEMGAKADKWEIVNIRDANGKSTWPQKNTEEAIDRVLSTISYNAQQREYFNNPIIEGETFDEVHYTRAPAIHTCDMVVVYCDPSTSNKDKPRGRTKSKSFKCVIVVGYKDRCFYTYWVRLEQNTNQAFVNWIFEAHEFLRDKKVDPIYMFIENNSLQDPHYQQVIIPAINKKAKDEKLHVPPLREDKRKKPEKYERIEGTLQPEHAAGHLYFDERIKDNPHMKTLHGQMLSVSPNAQLIDGPDALEGAVHLIKSRNISTNTTYRHGPRPNRRY